MGVVCRIPYRLGYFSSNWNDRFNNVTIATTFCFFTFPLSFFFFFYLSHEHGRLVESRDIGFRMRPSLCRVQLRIEKPSHGTRAAPIVIIAAMSEGFYLSGKIAAFACTVFIQFGWFPFDPRRGPRIIFFVRRKILVHLFFLIFSRRFLFIEVFIEVLVDLSLIFYLFPRSNEISTRSICFYHPLLMIKLLRYHSSLFFALLAISSNHFLLIWSFSFWEISVFHRSISSVEYFHRNCLSELWELWTIQFIFPRFINHISTVSLLNFYFIISVVFYFFYIFFVHTFSYVSISF